MKFLKFWQAGKAILDGVRAVVRIIRKDKPKNKFERTLEDIDDITDIIGGVGGIDRAG